MTYLDYQATTPLAPQALDAMLPWLRDQHANPHSPHRAGRGAKAAVEVAREQVATLMPPGGRVAFTSGATEALNWAIKGSTGPIVTIATEHAAVLDAVRATGRPATILPVGRDGLVHLDSAREAITPGTGLVAAMLVNNEIGVIQPIAALADLAHAVGALILCDAVQGYGRLAVPDGCDLVAVSAHKVYGPKGIGGLWIRDGVELQPLLHGGDQEGGRSGTLSPALCAGFGAAAALAAARLEKDREHAEDLFALASDRLFSSLSGECQGRAAMAYDLAHDGLNKAHLDRDPASAREGGKGWGINGSTVRRYPANLNAHRPGLDVARLMSDCRDVAFSAGSACASGSGRPSHVLRAIGLTDPEARSSIRLGWGRYTTEEELMSALDRIIAAADSQL